MQIIKSKTDFETNLERAFDEIDSNWRAYKGLVVLGTHSPSIEKAEERMNEIKKARTTNMPFLGICWGMHLAVIEYARNVLKIREADTTEINPHTKHPIVEKMPGVRVGQKHVILFGKFTLQSFWHNYKMNLKYLPLFVKDWHYSVNQNEEVVDFMVLKSHWHFVICQFHPEYQSSKDKPHQVLKDFLEACRLKTMKIGNIDGPRV